MCAPRKVSGTTYGLPDLVSKLESGVYFRSISPKFVVKLSVNVIILAFLNNKLWKEVMTYSVFFSSICVVTPRRIVN
jgi:hypothetical protein